MVVPFAFLARNPAILWPKERDQMDQSIGLLEAVAENTEMGKNTLDQILKMTDDAPLSEELEREKKAYHEFNQRAHAEMAERGSQVRGQTA